MGTVSVVLIALGTLVVGLIIGFFVARKLIMKQIEDNPPINEDMIKAMMRQMGRPASQKQVNQIMKSMNQHKK